MVKPPSNFNQILTTNQKAILLNYISGIVCHIYLIYQYDLL